MTRFLDSPPDGLAQRLRNSLGIVCLSVDVEWACDEVLADTVQLLDERGIRATFFCTHAGVEAPGHERGLHPNFRREGDTMKKFAPTSSTPTDKEAYRHVVRTTRTFCPEAVGVRAHSLFYDSQLLPLYAECRLQYESSHMLPLAPALAPVWKECGILELPIYYMDHFDLVQEATGFRLAGLHLERPGLKVIDFHPNMVFINATSESHYLRSKEHYHDPAALLRMRSAGRGVRTLFLELLDCLSAKEMPAMTLGDLNRIARSEIALESQRCAS